MVERGFSLWRCWDWWCFKVACSVWMMIQRDELAGGVSDAYLLSFSAVSFPFYSLLFSVGLLTDQRPPNWLITIASGYHDNSQSLCSVTFDPTGILGFYLLHRMSCMRYGWLSVCVDGGESLSGDYMTPQEEEKGNRKFRIMSRQLIRQKNEQHMRLAEEPQSLSLTVWDLVLNVKKIQYKKKPLTASLSWIDV